MTASDLVEEAGAPDASQFPPDSELLVRAAPGGAPRTALFGAGAAGAAGAVPHEGGMSPSVEFETDLFKGRVQLVVRQPEHQAPAARELLHGKQRQIWILFQGRLKRPIPLDDLQCGSWYARRLHLPAGVILYPAVEWLGRRLGGGLDLRLRGSSPHIVGCLVAGAQLLNVSRPGEEPREMQDVREDTRLLLGDEALAGVPMTTPQRRAYFRHAAHRAGRVWSPDHVITMFYFDHSFNYNTFKMLVPPCFHLDMVKVMDAQPVSISLRDRSTGAFLFRFEVWHRRMLTYLEAHKNRIKRRQAQHAAALAAANASKHQAAGGQQCSAAAAAAAGMAEAEAAASERPAAEVLVSGGGAAAAAVADGVADLVAGVAAVKVGLSVEADDLAAAKDVRLVG